MTTKCRMKNARKKKGEATASTFPLARELKTYESKLAGWADREGQFVLIKGGRVLGFFPGTDAALEAGYDKFGGESFLVKQIFLHEPIYQLGHVEI